MALIGHFALAGFLSLTGVAQAQTGSEFDHAGLAQQALERHIRPGYQRLAEAAGTLDGAVAPYCEQQTHDARKAVEAAFDAVVVAWGRIEHITFGPVTAGERLERIMFWPDRRGIGGRQLANALSSRDPTVVDAAKLAEKSVAMQGLPALDTLLFAAAGTVSEAPETRRHRCAFAAAVATNLAQITKAIAAAWTDPGGFSQSWLSPGPGSAHFLKPSETTLALAKAFDQGLEKVRDQRLGGPLGLNAQRRKLPAVLSKSGRAMVLVAANIDGLRELYVEGGMERAITATNGTDTASSTPSLAHLVATELQTARSGVAALVGVPSPFETQQNVERVIAVGFPLKNARTTAATLLSTSANLPMGFNASDGD
jgi:predicted lipoprotein